MDFAEFIWKQTGTQQQTADVLGWSRGKVSQYDMLDNISKEAWAIIATTFEEQEKLPAKSSVAANATVVAFSERLLYVCDKKVCVNADFSVADFIKVNHHI